MTSSNIWGRFKSGYYDDIQHFFPDGVPLESMIPALKFQDGRHILIVDLDRLTYEQLVAFCGPDLTELEAWHVKHKSIGLPAEAFWQLTDLS